MMAAYFKMKKNEWKVKAAIYGVIASFMENKKDISTLLQNMYTALKDIPAEDFQKELISNLTKMIHEENASKNL